MSKHTPPTNPSEAVIADAEKFADHLMANYSSEDLTAATIGAALMAALIAIQSQHKATFLHLLQSFTDHTRTCGRAHDALIEWPEELGVH